LKAASRARWGLLRGLSQYVNGVGHAAFLETNSWPPRRLGAFSPETGRKSEFSVRRGWAGDLLTKLLQIGDKKCYEVKGYKLRGRVYAIENAFRRHGGTSRGDNRAGPLSAVRGWPLGSRLLISASMLRHGGDVFLRRRHSRGIAGPRASDQAIPNDGAVLLKHFLP
jgi:hypothetical protein